MHLPMQKQKTDPIGSVSCFWWGKVVIVQCGSLFSSVSFGTANTGGAIPRPKNADTAAFS